MKRKKLKNWGKQHLLTAPTINVMIMSEANEGWTTLWIYLNQHLKM